MRVLLDTNILIHREAATIVREDIGDLFRWLDRIGAEKCIHQLSRDEIRRHSSLDVIRSFEAKLRSYSLLRTTPVDPIGFGPIRALDNSPNDTADSDLLREVVANRVDLLITEDRAIHRKASLAGVPDRVLTIDSFLERSIRDHPDLTDYPVLSVRQELFGNIDVTDRFFQSFREDYPDFNNWFNLKADQVAYTCRDDDGAIVAFLYLKEEGTAEPYPDIEPRFAPAKRLKIGTLKVLQNGYKIGERFLKIVFDNALLRRVDAIYITAFQRSYGQRRLANLLHEWGFASHGIKRSASGEEEVWVRDMTRFVRPDSPASTFPYVSRQAPKYIVPIYPEYHTELLPDSILRTESPRDFIEHEPHRNAIRKAYVSRSIYRALRPGNIIVFYRTSSGTAPAHHTSVATTIGVVESLHVGLSTFDQFRDACGTVSVFSDEQLRAQWDYKPRNRPFVVRFLYVYSLPKRPNLAALKNNNVIAEAPRGFQALSDAAFQRLLELANADDRFVVN